MIPLETIVAKYTGDTTDAGYTFTRCGGLYHALAARAGDDGEAVKTTINRLLAAGTETMISRQTVSKPDAAAAVAREMRDISDVYTQRMRTNYATVGRAFEHDKMILSDLEICKYIASQ
jgi:hypothetical protein